MVTWAGHLANTGETNI